MPDSASLDDMLMALGIQEGNSPRVGTADAISPQTDADEASAKQAQAWRDVGKCSH